MAGVPLYSTRTGSVDAPAVVILHGLLGSTRNWTTIARQLGEHYGVHCLDLRNHGASPHADSMRWGDLVHDVLRYVDEQGLRRFVLVGHSLGGKVAMRFAVEHPQRVAGLVVVDIVQRTYPPFHAKAFGAMSRLELSALSRRQEADRLLQVELPDWAFRQFILTNLERDPLSLEFHWRVNLPVLAANLSRMAEPSIAVGASFDGPTLLVAGGKSDFVTAADEPMMRQHFPQLQVQWMPHAGHNLHVEDRAGFVAVMEAFLQRSCQAAAGVP